MEEPALPVDELRSLFRSLRGCPPAASRRTAGRSPRRWIERYYNVQRYTEMPRGGDFAPMEEPGLRVDELRSSSARCAADRGLAL